jgi:hypothetical protein
VMPLENLVQDDAVEEPAETHAEQHGCDSESSPVAAGLQVVHDEPR